MFVPLLVSLTTLVPAAEAQRATGPSPAPAERDVATVSPTGLREGPHDVVLTVFRGDTAVTFPGGLRHKPTDWNYYGRASWPLDVVGPRAPLHLFDPGSDAERLSFSRIGDAGRRGLFRVGMSEASGRPVFHVALPVDSSGWSPPDYTASLVIASRIRARQETIAGAEAVRLRLRGLGPQQILHVTLMEGRRHQLERGGAGGQHLERAIAAAHGLCRGSWRAAPAGFPRRVELLGGTGGWPWRARGPSAARPSGAAATVAPAS
jgi:hypothetical protein